MRTNERPPLCAICGHVKAKHVESLMAGHVVCRAKNCQCTLYQLPENWKTTAEYGVAYIGKDDKCNNCGHFYREHTQVDDREKAQAHWPCMRCDCKDYDFWSEKNLAVDDEAKGTWEHDPVNHPSHYTAYPGIEIIQLTRHMSFNRGNAVKYTARAGLKDKDTEVQDLEKAIWYLQDEVKLLKGEYDA